MSDYLNQKGYIYPLGKLTDEENDAFYKKIEEEKNLNLNQDKFVLESLGKKDYLIWLTYSTYGEKSDEFGLCRPCNQQEIYYHAPKFREILGEIDTAKLKYIDFCYYNSTECTTDYYLEEEEEYKPMTLEQAINHAKEVAASKCDECGKEHAKLAEWLQELQGYKDKTYITAEWLTKNDFEFRVGDKNDKDFYLFCDDVVEISAKLHNEEAGEWKVEVTFLDYGDTQKLYIITIGQLRMFLAVCGLDNIVEQLK